MTGYVAPSVHDVPERVLARFWSNVTIGTDDCCWPWKLSIGSHGYGQVGWWDNTLRRSAMTTAHRVAWLASVGPIPEGMTVDHLCHQRRCCNPAHLRLLSNVENARDNSQGRKMSCPAGHTYDLGNTYVNPRGHRFCRQCVTDRRRRAA